MDSQEDWDGSSRPAPASPAQVLAAHRHATLPPAQERLVNIVSLLDRHAHDRPEKRACVFLKDGETESAAMSYAQLAGSARSLAAALGSAGAPGERVLLALPDGIDFVVTFLACLRAGLIAVPVKPPQNREASRKVLAIAANCGASTIICDDAMRLKLRTFFPDDKALAGMRHLAPQALAVQAEAHAQAGSAPSAAQALAAEGLAYLQYTSGSTGAPKGVMVSHAHVMANEEMIRRRWGASERDVLLSWLPMFHDMGLIAAVLQSIYLGATCVLMPPVAFVQKPARWMAAASRYRATITGGPNFAFRALCADRVRDAAIGLDLSSLRVVYCGSEPISAAVVLDFLDGYARCGFDRRAFSAGYGMAEATLMVSAGGIGHPPVFARLTADGVPRIAEIAGAGDLGLERTVISCGESLQMQTIRIVDPESFKALQDGEVGEIWLHGPHIAAGYWENPEATAATFGARIAGEDGPAHLRSGDLGFMLGDQLFVTGRIKELMIFNGTNHYPQDIEGAISGCHPALSLGRAAAFSCLAPGGESLVVVQEVNRDLARNLSRRDADDIIDAVKSAIYSQHGVPAREVVLVRLNSIPRTTSGKICRVSSKKLHGAGQLDVLPITTAAITTTTTEPTQEEAL